MDAPGLRADQACRHAGAAAERHLHVAGLGWNTNASGMLNGSYWGMQSAYDAHVVQVQLPVDSSAGLVWGAPRASVRSVALHVSGVHVSLSGASTCSPCEVPGCGCVQG